MLELSSLDKAISSLERALKVYNQKLALENTPADEIETIKAGVIQNFEFTYELCWKFMKRWIEQNISLTTVDGATRRELFRVSAESLLIDNVDEWMEYHQSRNMTSHIYDVSIADEVLKSVLKFFPAARIFQERLMKRND